jgi:hypothetical protein
MSAFSTAQSGAKSATSSMPSKTRFAYCRCGWPVARTRSPGSVLTRLSVGPRLPAIRNPKSSHTGNVGWECAAHIPG